MNDSVRKSIYWVATGLLTAIALMYVGNSIFNNEMFSQRFERLGYPTYIIYPIAIAKMLGLVAILSDKSKTLKEWAYAGFFFNFVLAILAEMRADDGELLSSTIATIALLVSFNLWKTGIRRVRIGT